MNLATPTKHITREQMVEETIERLHNQGKRSQLHGLDSVTLKDMCMRLTDRSFGTTADVYRWLNKELGGTDEEPAIDDNAVYRYAQSFRQTFNGIRKEHTYRMAKLTVDESTGGDIENMTKLAQLRLVELVTEQLLGADDVSSDLTPNEVRNAYAIINNAQVNQRDDVKLEKAVELADQRIANLEADLNKKNLEIKEKQDKLDKAKAELEALENQAKESTDRPDTGSISLEDIQKVRSRLFG